ncbi:hypothetical protein B0A52_01328 [Exophiala mesophila]|uniref:S1 motif domain-containing protein n=1 Tax=Exophiala mesophila TaxID=212818 RepID=A0A438NH35_EXOME|nr:hypothetical protein B0A52_01328 [Exophiala mesophila]
MSSGKRKLGTDDTKSANKRSRSDSKTKPSKSSETTKPRSQNPPKESQPSSKPPPPSVLSKEQPAFPRGGAGLLTPIERRQIQAKAVRDATKEHQKAHDLFGASGGKPQDSSDEEEGLSSGDEQVKPEKKPRKTKPKDRKKSAETEKPEVFIGGLSYKRITTDSLILSQITSIGPRFLTVALPNNLVGYVPLTSISPKFTQKVQLLLNSNGDADNASDSGAEDSDHDIDLTHHFRVGQYLRTAVTSTEQEKTTAKSQARKRIELSIDPSLTNKGLSRSNLAVGTSVQVSVNSVEDHGLAVDLAFEEGTAPGFVLKKHLPPGATLDDFKPGAVLLCVALDSDTNRKVIKLSADLTSAPALKSASSVDSFLPGAVAEILISDTSDSGLSGKVMGLLNVTADVVHSGSFKDKQAFLSQYNVGQKVLGRLLCTFPLSENKHIGFSILPNLINLESSRTDGSQIPLSSTIDSATIIRVEPGLGVYLSLDDKSIGFAHVSRLSDKKVESISEVIGAYKLGTEHRARVLEYNPVDNLYLVSLQQSVLSRPFLRIEDVPTGAVAKGEIETILIGSSGVEGLIVKLAEGISGLVPAIHMSDIELKNPEKKFREGQSVTVRVLSTDPLRKRLRLTLKKSLVNSDQKEWKSFDAIEVGDSTVGTIFKVDRAGAVMQFFGPVKAFLPVSEMSEAFIKDAREHFRVGQVLTVNAISVNPSEERLTVSCREVNTSGPSVETSLAKLQSGTVTTGTIFEKSQDDVLLRLEGSDAIARLTLDHVSDGSLKKRESAMSKLRVGQKLENILILQVQLNRRLVLLSNKQSLIKAAQDGTLLRSFDQLGENASVTGYVSNITETGIFVGFASGISGLLAKNEVPVENESLPDFGLSKLQTISAKVLRIDYKGATPRFWLTMREKGLDQIGNKRSKTESFVPGTVPLSSPVDPALKTWDDLVVGKVTKAKVISVKDTQINVELAKDVQGRIDASEAFDKWEEIKDRKKPLKQFSGKEELIVKILGAHDTRNHRFLPLTHRSSKNTVFELSCKPSTIAKKDVPNLSIEEVQVGSKWLAFVNNISDTWLWVNLSPTVRGRIKATDVSDDLSLVADLEENFPIGSALRVHVLAVDVDKNRLDLSAKSQTSSKPLTLDAISKGLVLPGRVTKITERNVVVQLSDHVVGVVELIDMADDYTEANPAKYEKNEILRVSVVKVDIPNKRVFLSTRPSKVLSSSLEVEDAEITSYKQLTVNAVVRGFISNVSDKGIFVTLGHGITAFVRISNLSDSYLKDWKSHFQRDQLVKGKITLVDSDSGHVQMTLKESALSPDYKAPITFNDLKVGDIVTGKVAKAETFGVFIRVDNSENVRGLCHRSEIAEKPVVDATNLFSEGDTVKAKVLKIEPSARRVNFGMKPSYFADQDESMSDDDDSEMDGGAQLDVEMADVEPAGEEEDSEDDEGESALDLSEDDAIEQEDLLVNAKVPPPPTKALSVGGFDWYGVNDSTIPPSSKPTDSDTDTDAQAPALKKKKKHRAEIQVDHTGDLDTDGPQSSDDFELLLLSEPDSSLLWLQYMAFHLKLGDADQARSIGERGLRSIGLGRDPEKLNVWIALLNLENAYGDDESIDAMFKRACEYNDPQDIYTRLTSIYIHSGKHDKADALFQRMLKKFTQDPKIWINYATFLFDTADQADQARALLSRALQTLPKFTHFDITSKFAQLEFKSENGLPERGRTIFEGLISSFPKRVDVFNVLLDLEMKRSDDEDGKEQVRGVFERIFGGSSKLKVKQAKHFFKRWLEFEERGGDERRVEEVKARATEWLRAHGKEE